MFKEAVDKYGKVDVLVNNAGIARDGLMVRMKPEQWQQVRRYEAHDYLLLMSLEYSLVKAPLLLTSFAIPGH